MHILASILDPADNGFDISDLSVLIGVILTISVTTATVVRWNAKRVAVVRAKEREAMEQRLRDYISQATKAIQPDYRNNGTSLTDVAETVKYVSQRLDSHIDWHLDTQ